MECFNQSNNITVIYFDNVLHNQNIVLPLHHQKRKTLKVMELGQVLNGKYTVIGISDIIHGPKYPNLTIKQEVFLKGKRGAIYKGLVFEKGWKILFSIDLKSGFINQYFEGRRVIDGRELKSDEELLIEKFTNACSLFWGIGVEHVKVEGQKLKFIVQTKYSALTFLDKFKQLNVSVSALDRNDEYQYCNPFLVEIPLSKAKEASLILN